MIQQINTIISNNNLKTTNKETTFYGHSRLIKSSKDVFEKSAEKIPETLTNAIQVLSSKLNTITPKNKIEIPLSTYSSRIVLKDLLMVAEAVESNNILVSIKYTHPNRSGLIPVANGSIEDIKKVFKNPDFLSNLDKKLKQTSDKVFFNRDPDFEF